MKKPGGIQSMGSFTSTYILHLLHFISGSMDPKNATLLSMFVLTGLPYQLEWQIPLFLLFLVIYLITIVGNLGLIALICSDPHLHIPTYLFLGKLAFVDAWISSTMTPKMMVNFCAKNKTISLTESKIRYFSLCSQCNHRTFSAGNNGI